MGNFEPGSAPPRRLVILSLAVVLRQPAKRVARASRLVLVHIESHTLLACLHGRRWIGKDQSISFDLCLLLPRVGRALLPSCHLCSRREGVSTEVARPKVVLQQGLGPRMLHGRGTPERALRSLQCTRAATRCLPYRSINWGLRSNLEAASAPALTIHTWQRRLGVSIPTYHDNSQGGGLPLPRSSWQYWRQRWSLRPIYLPSSPPRGVFPRLSGHGALGR